MDASYEGLLRARRQTPLRVLIIDVGGSHVKFSVPLL